MAGDLVVRNATIVDGSGGEPFVGDVAVRDGIITAVGPRLEGSAREEIEARGNLLTPGFVDVHTHYDGQLSWEPTLAPSSLHGVTTVVAGNCGVGFAPCRPADRDALVRLMEGVEDIPGTALAEGLPWTWESYPEFLDALDREPHDIDFALYVPHGPLRLYAMGKRCVAGEPATEDDIATMRGLLEDGIRAGALGFSTSRTLMHRSSDGRVTPMYAALRREIVGLAHGMSAAGGGLFQMVSDFMDVEAEHAILEVVARIPRCHATYSLVKDVVSPGRWRKILDRTEDARYAKIPITPQVFTRPIGVFLGLECSLHPFMASPTYRAMADLPLTERVRAMRRPEVKRLILEDKPRDLHPFFHTFGRKYDLYFPLGDPPCYEPSPETSFAARAKAEKRKPLDLIYDALLEDEGRALVYFTLHNYGDRSLDAVRAMMAHDDVVFGLGDGGAHVASVCDASGTTTTLTHWGRDRRKERFPIEWLVRFLTARPAELVGLGDRGRIAVGYRADLNVIDFDRLTVTKPELRHDLPAGGKRFHQGARGYRATIVAGEIVYRDGEPTGKRPGRLVRGPRPSLAVR